MPAPTLIADRFVANGASSIDLASGDAVRLRVTAAGERDAQFLWSDACAVHARLRHPFLNPLVDYGAIDRYRVFEAYAALQPIPAAPAVGQRLLIQAIDFLRAHGIELTGEHATCAVRSVVPHSSPRRGRTFGIVLHDRLALTSVAEVLDAAAPGGPCQIAVSGDHGCGLRTLRVLVARAARVRGYVPVTPGVIVARPWVADALVERHVCVLTVPALAPPERHALTTLLARLGRASTRRHVVITFARNAPAGWNVIPIGPMGVTNMTSMVFVDANGPSPAELFEAARNADGKPGVFLERLGARSFEPHVSRALVAHEAVQPYYVTRDVSTPPAFAQSRSPRRPGVLTRAADRADDLARRGRHVAALRLLTRATRVLAGRGEANLAARCAERLGRLHLDRGQTVPALERFERARALATDPIVTRAATLGIALAWLDDARLTEAEALLRSLAVSAVIEQRPDAAVACALGRCLYWQGRYAEAALTIQPHVDENLAQPIALAAMIRVAEGDITAGLQLARRASAAIAASAPEEVRAEVQRTLAATLSAAGDDAAAGDHIVTAISAARRAHLPQAAIRARITQLDVLARADSQNSRARRLAERLAALGKQPGLPHLLVFQIEKTVEQVSGTPPGVVVAELEQKGGARWPRPPRSGEGKATALTELESMLEVCHAAPDDAHALDRLCAAALERTGASSVLIVTGNDRRVRGHAGRPWDGESPIVHRALSSGAGVPPSEHRGDARLEAAEPVKFAGEVVGAVVCRWIPGAAISPARAAATLKAAALAAAAPVRGVIDRAVPELPGHAWTDLLGESPGAVAVRDAAARAARAPYPVLIEGESGSGKELVARAVHRLSPRRDRRFCAVNCAAFSDELLEAELFGHTRGAFTGAIGERAGLFEEADGGTLFLDEVGELSARAQAKLLRVIQEGEIRRVGETFSRKVDVRIVAATNRRLQEEAAAGRFRSDLRFRLDVIRVVVPPLRERLADIPLLATHFWNDAATRVGSRATLSPDALAALSRYDWPGNVRELQNVIAWMAVHSPRRGRIGSAALPSGVAGALTTAAVTFETARDEFERRFIRSALARANGHRASAAESLGITRQGLAKMIRRLGIEAR